ncbi:maleylpyruvate isomerase family mycothiol-dependent enzyme [Pseudonocardia sp. TRM90224]|uniref:maleylpyruvate isomerase family mycothiol-dependent enzyme n=1 Tax=Pseudonocardia sp. TRM90224 TaxID=2812678 RepID=UPI001E5C7583|nr:maleylpyruvate isomerase family mycothiol-dependent enzyme [Pseudonocardia sp. TRM90224]
MPSPSPSPSPSSSPELPREAVDAAVAAERRSLADHVADLSDEQWATRSLCPAWTVRDVVAHLTTTTRTGVLQVARAVLRARGDLDRVEVDLAAQRAAAHSTAELVAQLRESADSSRRAPGSSPMDPLMDIVIHGQDIARPLGRRYDSPADVVAACLAYVATRKFLGGPKRLAGLRIVSSDTGWSLGAGAEVRGPDIDLLMITAGRRAGLAALDGPGLATLAERLA